MAYSVLMKYLYPCLPPLYQPEVLSLQISLSQTNVGPTYLLPDKLFSLSASNVNATFGVCLSVFLSVYVSVCLCVCVSVYVCVCLRVFVSVCLKNDSSEQID